jgi:hypothetical protein
MNRLLMANVRFLQKLIGTWEGCGVCVYPPNVPEIRYKEQLTITQGAKPVVFGYKSVTQDEVTGKTLHVESGFFRCAPPGDHVELIASHPFGVAEISEGILTGDSLELVCDEDKGLIRSSSVSGAKTTGLIRRYTLADGVLKFSMEMATDSHKMQNHLVSTLKRV